MTEPSNHLMNESTSDRQSAKDPDLFHVRFIALGALIVFLSLFGGEKLVWRLADPDSKVFFNESLRRVGAPDITPSEKDAIRSETLHRLAQPEIILVGILILSVPLWVGILLGGLSASLWNAPIAVFAGVWVTLAITQAVSIGAAIASIIFAAFSIPGSMLGKKVQKWRMRN
ncbi:MAG: hypothetical protein JXX29_18490 [Deltaproteobacteria bacterium]|nr:hypothetical protein [Deltaproteobacteria bacterium]MBN2673675.1 hypothetical protein [Deltaproteobacteria bacterium]